MACIQFIQGINETRVPTVKLTRSKQGITGTATFFFDHPDAFEQIEKDTKIVAMYLISKNYRFVTKDIHAKFINGRPSEIIAVCVLTNPEDWDLFLKFMEVYAKNNGLFFRN